MPRLHTPVLQWCSRVACQRRRAAIKLPQITVPSTPPPASLHRSTCSWALCSCISTCALPTSRRLSSVATTWRARRATRRGRGPAAPRVAPAAAAPAAARRRRRAAARRSEDRADRSSLVAVECSELNPSLTDCTDGVAWGPCNDPPVRNRANSWRQGGILSHPACTAAPGST